MKCFVLLLCAVSATSISVRAASISSISVSQRRPVSGLVDIEYTLSGANSPVDIAFSASDGALELDIPCEALCGDLCDVENGKHRITLDVGKTRYSGGFAALRVSLDLVDAKKYMILDFVNDTVSYSADVIGENGRWDEIYKTDKVVLRRCHAGTFVMGSPIEEPGRKTSPYASREKQRMVKISQPFYIGVFEFTQRQLQHLYGNERESIFEMTYFTNNAYYAVRPADNVNYNQLRGVASKFPEDDEVAENSIIDRLRKRFAIRFDLPTEAQWEYACRAGTSTALYNGEVAGNESETFGLARRIGCVGRNTTTFRNSDFDSATSPVGMYESNAWGLYDMCGNVFEWTCDWCALQVPDDECYLIDPTIPKSLAYADERGWLGRSLRGGAYNSLDCTEVRSASRGRGIVDERAANRTGFRICSPAPYARNTPIAVEEDIAVSDVNIVSHWPWEAKVDICYAISGVKSPVDIEVSAVTASGESLHIAASALEGDFMEVGNGFHRLTWNLEKSAYSNRISLDGVRFSLSPVSARTYMICDIGSGKVSYTNEIVGSNGVWDDRFFSGSIVLRRCPSGVFTMGSPSDETYRQSTPNTAQLSSGDTREAQHRVKITSPFYIGVFEITQGQYELLLGRDKRLEGSWYTNETFYAKRPMDKLTFGMVRGSTKGSKYPDDDEVDEASLVGEFRKRFGIRFDIPTEAQWEYAYRAGTKSAFYNGGDPGATEAEYIELAKKIGHFGWRSTSESNRNADLASGTKVSGSFLGNGWGLYDMAGNVWEWTRDYAKLKVTETHEIDPVNLKADSYNNARSVRGGALGDEKPSNMRAAARGQSPVNNSNNLLIGCRISAPLPY